MHEKFLDEFYAERKRISGPDERTLHPGNSLVNEADTITHEIVDTHARLNTTNAGGSIEIGEESIIQGLVIDSLPAQMLTSKSSDAAIISDENDPDTAFENSQRDIGNLSMYSNNMEHIIESFMLENGQHERQIESVFESETNPYVTLARYKHALLIVCMSNAKEVIP